MDCGVGCKLAVKVKGEEIKCVEGVNGRDNENRVCVEGGFGFDYVHHDHRLTKPLSRRDDAPAKGLNVDPANPLTHFREVSWEEALDVAANGFIKHRDISGKRIAGFGSAN